MRWVWLPLALLLLASEMAKGTTWYYWVDQPPLLEPGEVYFLPSTRLLFCAALKAAAPGPGPLAVDFTGLDAGCPDSPYVVYGEDPNGNPVYAIRLRVKFWGENNYKNRNTGVKRLLQIIQNYYAFRVGARGDFKPRIEYHPPFDDPDMALPLLSASIDWHRWAQTQDVPLTDQAAVENAHDYKKRDPESATCRDLYGKNECWSAELVWALPVRLVLEGGEIGDSTLSVNPDIFVKKPVARALRFSAKDGRLTPEVLELRRFPPH